MEEKKLIKEFIKQLIENNDYYEHIKNEYDRNENKQYYIDRIYLIFAYWFDSYYSVYTIMDTIEEDMQNNGKTFKQVAESETMEIKSRW